MGVVVSDERLRRMYRAGRADRAARLMARFWALVFGLGLAPRRWVALEVAGRRTGRPRRYPLGMADRDGRWYLVSMLGDRSGWVRNVRAAGGDAVLRHGRGRPVHLVEVAVADRPAILRRYLLTVPGARPHVPVAPDGAEAELAAIAARYPVFRVDPRVSRGRAAPAPPPSSGPGGRGRRRPRRR